MNDVVFNFDPFRFQQVPSGYINIDGKVAIPPTAILLPGDTGGGNQSGATSTGPSQKPPKTGTQQQPSIDWSKVGKAALSCAADHYGLTALAGGAGALGLPVPKSWLGLAPGFAGASENTSVAGAIGFKLFGAAEPRIGVRLLGTTRLFGVIGRAAPGVSAALFAYDAASIGYCTYQAVK